MNLLKSLFTVMVIAWFVASLAIVVEDLQDPQQDPQREERLRAYKLKDYEERKFFIEMMRMGYTQKDALEIARSYRQELDKNTTEIY